MAPTTPWGTDDTVTVVDEIKQRLDIVELIGEYVPLQKAGRNYKGLCPFHTEKTPSFVVFPETQGWHCFGACSTGGDAFAFIIKHENLTFQEALRLLAEKTGVELRPLDAAGAKQQDETERLRAINGASAQFYHRILMDSAQGQPGRLYLEGRGVKRETMTTFQLGYAPQGWHALEEHLQREHFSSEDCLTAGVLTKNERGNVYDRFRGRAMFPIRDAQGHVIGFGGRTLGDDTPKYLNTSQTPIFDKGALLYGIDLTRRSIRDTGTAVIVEGYMDVIIPYQQGITNLVACMGTALTEAHFRALRRITKVLVLALDADNAGIRAAEKGTETAREFLQHHVVPVLSANGLIRYESQLDADIRVMVLPEGLDPDELVLQDRQLWDRLVDQALPAADYLLQLYTGMVDLKTARGKRELVARVIPIIGAMDSTVEQSHYVQRLGQLVHVEERELRIELRQWARESSQRRPATRPARPQPRQDTSAATRSEQPPHAIVSDQPLSLEERCLALLIAFPDLVATACEPATGLPDAQAAPPALLGPEDIQEARNRQILETLLATSMAKEDSKRQAFRDALDSESNAHVQSLLHRLDREPPLERDAAFGDLAKCAARLRKDHLLHLIRELRFMQQAAQTDLGAASTEQAASQLRELNRAIERLTRDYLQVDQSYHAATIVGRSKRAHSS